MVPEADPRLYRFAGRVIGKALFDRQLMNGNLEMHLIKHILGWPIQFKDLEFVDPEYFYNLKKLQEFANAGDDLSLLCLDFATYSRVGNGFREIELIEGGANIEVTNENLSQYIEACFQYKMFGGFQTQLKELLLGIFDVVPESLLSIFNPSELEALVFGLGERCRSSRNVERAHSMLWRI